MQRKYTGNIVIVALVFVNIALWLILGPVNDGTRANFTRQVAGEIIGSTAVVLIACALFLSTRLFFLQPYFGGLDQMYQSHKQAAMLAIFLLFGHFFALPLNANQVKPGTPLGVIAFLGLLALVLLTIAPRIPVIAEEYPTVPLQLAQGGGGTIGRMPPEAYDGNELGWLAERHKALVAAKDALSPEFREVEGWWNSAAPPLPMSLSASAL